jgi:DNA repair exonuclease SbcCD ATPase subunit
MVFTMKLYNSLTAVFFALVFFYSLPLLGQPFPGDNRHEKVIERIKQLQVWKLTERLKLTEEQSVRFFAKYNRYQEEVAKSLEKLNDVMSQLEDAKMSNLSEAELDKKIDEALQLRQESAASLQRYTKDFRQVISARQMAELVVFERDFIREITNFLARQDKQKKMRDTMPDPKDNTPQKK